MVLRRKKKSERIEFEEDQDDEEDYPEEIEEEDEIPKKPRAKEKPQPKITLSEILDSIQGNLSRCQNLLNYIRETQGV